MRILGKVLPLVVLFCLFGGSLVGQTIRCSSNDGRRHYCNADTRNGVVMTKQVSGAACQQGYSWDYDERAIWVDHGCRADFALESGAAGYSGKTIYCASDDGRKHYCKTETRAGVALVKQRSGSACQQDYSWGFDDRGVWVDHGCRADFALEARPQDPPSDGNGRGNSVVRCSSDDGGRHYCQADTRGDVELLNQRSHAECRQGHSWGYDQQGVWVDHGCRADFIVEPNERPENPEMGSGGQSLYCPSDDGRRHSCQADTRGGVEMVKQRSESSCQQGYSWGYDDREIWVDHGCRADFVTGAGADYPARGAGHGRSCARSVGEQRANQLVEQCLQASPGTHPPCSAQNSCKMITDEIRRSCELLGNGAPGFCAEYR
jgi:hypothetical protein